MRTVVCIKTLTARRVGKIARVQGRDEAHDALPSARSIIFLILRASSFEIPRPCKQRHDQTFRRTSKCRLDEPLDHRAQGRLPWQGCPVTKGVTLLVATQPALLLQPREHRQHRTTGDRAPSRQHLPDIGDRGLTPVPDDVHDLHLSLRQSGQGLG